MSNSADWLIGAIFDQPPFAAQSTGMAAASQYQQQVAMQNATPRCWIGLNELPVKRLEPGIFWESRGKCHRVTIRREAEYVADLSQLGMRAM